MLSREMLKPYKQEGGPANMKQKFIFPQNRNKKFIVFLIKGENCCSANPKQQHFSHTY